MQNRPSVWNGIPVPYGATVDELAQLIHGPGPARWAAFVAVAHTADESALALLQDSARSPHPNVRRIAVEAIGIHPQGARLASAIRTLLTDPSPVVVRSACEAAARQRVVDAHDRMVELLDDRDDSTRAAAVQALRDLWRDADLARVLRAFSSDASVEVRKEAAWTLRSAASPSNWHELFAVWHADSMPRYRQWACELAAAFGNGGVVPDLHRLTGDPDGHVRNHAVGALRALEKGRFPDNH